MSSGPDAKPRAAGLEAGRGVRVEFYRIGDLFSHALWLDTVKVEGPLLHSEVGLPPCLTQLHQQPGSMLLTGSAGGCHWSMSVEGLGPGILLFDVACRIKQPMAGLCSVYRLGDGLQGEVSERGELAVIRLSNVGSLKIGSRAESHRCRVLQPSPKVLQIGSPDSPSQQFPATARWSYAVWVD